MIEILEPAPLGTTRIQNPAYRPAEEITGAPEKGSCPFWYDPPVLKPGIITH